MAVKYIKDHKTQETVYPITKSECIIDAHSINNCEIDQLFDGSSESESSDSGMDYLNYNGLKHYHKKISEEVQTSLNNVQVDLTGYATESLVENKGYLTEHQDISGKVDVADFEEAAQVTSTALNQLKSDLAVKEDMITGIQNDVSGLSQRVGILEENSNESTTYTEIIFSGIYGTHVLNLLGQVIKPQVTYNIVDTTLYCGSDSVIDSTLIFIGGKIDKNTLIL